MVGANTSRSIEWIVCSTDRPGRPDAVAAASWLRRVRAADTSPLVAWYLVEVIIISIESVSSLPPYTSYDDPVRADFGRVFCMIA
jgi:hypothetical protein